MNELHPCFPGNVNRILLPAGMTTKLSAAWSSAKELSDYAKSAINAIGDPSMQKNLAELEVVMADTHALVTTIVVLKAVHLKMKDASNKKQIAKDTKKKVVAMGGVLSTELSSLLQAASE